MIIRIDEYSDVPIYMQIRNQIVMGISSGELKGGEQLPTVRALALYGTLMLMERLKN